MALENKSAFGRSRTPAYHML